ncbi:hypothetical protein [Dactylosporangium sp. NPDC048998]|uniref:hypothetical protein n=1 Tax=Dactylosporangium sp. NPDC048998 TaxID=3363976 RepID=UPI00371D063A
MGGGSAEWIAPDVATGKSDKFDISDVSPTAGFVWPEGAGPSGGRRKLSPQWARGLDVLITVAGLIVATLLAAALAIIEALYSPLRIGGVRAPVSLLMALVTNPLLGWFAFTTTRQRFAGLLPAAAWCVIWILAAGRTSEGDMIITNNNWVGLLTLLVGAPVFAVGIYVSSMRERIAPRWPSGPASGSSSSSSSRPAGG